MSGLADLGRGPVAFTPPKQDPSANAKPAGQSLETVTEAPTRVERVTPFEPNRATALVLALVTLIGPSRSTVTP